MAHPYRIAPPKEPKASAPSSRLRSTSFAFSCVCVVAGCALAREDGRLAFASAVVVGGLLVARRSDLPR